MRDVPSILLASGHSWAEHGGCGYRTRQGAFHATLPEVVDARRMIVLKLPGVRGAPSLARSNHGKREIVDVTLPGLLPEWISRSFGRNGPAGLLREPAQLDDICETSDVRLAVTWAPSIIPWIRRRWACPVLFDVVDDRREDENLTRSERVAWRRRVEDGCSLADAVTYNAPGLGEFVLERKLRAREIRNGVDPARFDGMGRIERREGFGFVGALSKWTDVDLLLGLARSMPEERFLLQGTVHVEDGALDRLRREPNLEWRGFLEPEAVPSFLGSLKALVVPYDRRRTNHASGDSMKIWEALAAGTPVVSTPFQPALDERFGGLVVVKDGLDGFAAALRDLPTGYALEAWRLAARRFVEANTWATRCEEMAWFAGVRPAAD